MKKWLFLLIIMHATYSLRGQNITTPEALFAQPFTHDLSADAFREALGIFTKINREVVQNVHYPSISDTLVHIKYFKSYIHLYKAREKTLLFKFHIQNRRVKLIEDIHKGMKRQELEQMIPDWERNDGDTITLHDPDNTVEIEFVFNRWNRLKVMKFRSEIF